jgi:uncharacterized glyoxalase superfamily protein PhnB
MQLQDLYPIIVTPEHKGCRDFYLKWFGATVLFEASWIDVLTIGGDAPRTLAFMSPDHPSTPPGPERFSGEGVFLTFQVEDAAAEFARLRGMGATFAYELKDEAWGQRRFALRDPAGTWIDIVEQTAPAAGFWDPYLSPG